MAEIKKKNINQGPQEKEIKIRVEDISDDAAGRVYVQENKKSKNIKSFSDFYKNTSNSKSELSKIEKQDPNRKKKITTLVIVGLIFILGITIGGFYYFISQEDKFGSDSIDIETVIPTLISSGDNVGITITVHNREQVDILNAELIIQYPDDFTFKSSDPIPKNEANNAWSLGEIKAGDSESITLTGQIFGEINTAKNFKTILNYMPENFSSEFQKNDSFDLLINDSVYDLILTVPTKVVNGLSSAYSVKITNGSEEDVSNLKLVLVIPENLKVSKYDPIPDVGSSSWEIKELKSDEEFVVNFDAILEGEEGDVAEIKAEVGYYSNNNYLVQEKKSAIVFVVNPQLLLNISVNDSVAGFSVDIGDNLKYKISYQNDSQSEIKDLNISAELVGDLLDWDTLADSNDGQIEGNTITWNQDQIEKLASIKPGDEGEILFSINIFKSYNFSSEDEINLSVSSSASAISNDVVDIDEGSLKITSNEVENKLNSKIDLRAEGRYYDDEYIQVGAGPLPPEVGQVTKYKIFWFLQNGSNEITDVSVSAVLPDDILWTGSTNVNAGSISYNSNTRTVSWTINKVPEHVGQFLAELQASFEISVKPVAADLGQVIILLNNSNLTATDDFTSQENTITQDIISTALEFDPIYGGDGLVVTGVNINSNSNLNTSTNINSNVNSE